MIFVDGHVHIYDCFDVEQLFDAALTNFTRAAGRVGSALSEVSFVLLLVEGKMDTWFHDLQQAATKDGQMRRQISSHWHVELDLETSSCVAFRDEQGSAKVHIICGQQLVSKEKLEVLSLFCSTKIENGLPVRELLSSIEQSQGIAVLPWGAGKWLGQRGKIVADLVSEWQGRHLFLGDNGGRPCLWLEPSLLQTARQNGKAILSGSDPLPLPAEAKRVGSFGFYVDCPQTEEQAIVSTLKAVLLRENLEENVFPFGKLQNNLLFLANQFTIRFSS